MVDTIEKALAVQCRRYESGKPFFAKSVKRFLKRDISLTNVSPTELEKLGKVCWTPPGFKRNENVFGESYRFYSPNEKEVQ